MQSPAIVRRSDGNWLMWSNNSDQNDGIAVLSIQIFQFFRITGTVDGQIVAFADQLQIAEIRNNRYLSGAEGKIDQLVRCG